MLTFRRAACWSAVALLVPLFVAASVCVALALPEPFFAYHIERGRLALYSDRPFRTTRAGRILSEIDARISRSPLDAHNGAHRIFVANDDWRQRLFFNVSYGVGGVNYYPLSRNVFLRNSDVDHDTLVRPNGTPAERPRTFTYFAAHEIGHSLTGEWLGPEHLWNWRLPVWIREGVADYVGLGGRGTVDVDSMYVQYLAHNPQFDPKSGFYDRYRMLAAYFLDRKGWPVQRLLLSNLQIQDAEKIMDADMLAHGRFQPL